MKKLQIIPPAEKKLFYLKEFQLKKQIKKIFGFTILGGIFGFLLYFTLARMLTPEEYGIFYTFIVFTFFFMIGQESIKIFSAKYATKYFCNKDIEKINLLYKKNRKKIMLYSVPLFLLFLSLYPFIGKNLLHSTFFQYCLFGTSLFFVFLYPLCVGILQGINHFKESSFIYTIYSIIFYCGALLSVLLKFNLNGILFSIVCTNAIVSFLSLEIVNKRLKEFQAKFKTEKNKNIFSIKNSAKKTIESQNEMKKFFLAILTIFGLLMLFSMIDVLLARYFFSAFDSGLYSGLSTIAKLLFFASLTISKGLFLKIIESGELNKKEIKKETDKMLLLGFLTNFALGVLFFAGAYFFPELIIKIVLGNKYIEFSYLLKYVVLSMALLALSTFITFYNLSLNWNKKLTARVLIAFLFLQIVLVLIFHESLIQFVIINIISNLILLMALLSTIKTDEDSS